MSRIKDFVLMYLNVWIALLIGFSVGAILNSPVVSEMLYHLQNRDVPWWQNFWQAAGAVIGVIGAVAISSISAKHREKIELENEIRASKNSIIVWTRMYYHAYISMNTMVYKYDGTPSNIPLELRLQIDEMIIRSQVRSNDMKQNVFENIQTLESIYIHENDVNGQKTIVEIYKNIDSSEKQIQEKAPTDSTVDIEKFVNNIEKLLDI